MYNQTWHAVTLFIATMLLHPEVQKKAQDELDRVIGRDRLPELSDRDSVPYIQCVVYETMRCASRRVYHASVLIIHA